MKDSKTYAQKISTLFKKLKKNTAVKPVKFDCSVDSIIYAALIEYLPFSKANSIFKKIHNHFVDNNDLRVARNEEIIDVLGGDNETNQQIASQLRKVLNSIFNRYDMLNLESLLEEGKRQAKKDLESLDGISPFMVSYCFLTSLHGHAIPVTQTMVDYLKQNGLVHPNSDLHDITGFLERQISASDAYAFFYLLKSEADSASASAAKSAKTAAKTKSKTVKKKTKTKAKTKTKTKTQKKTAPKKTKTKKKTKKKTKTKSK